MTDDDKVLCWFGGVGGALVVLAVLLGVGYCGGRQDGSVEWCKTAIRTAATAQDSLVVMHLPVCR